MTKTPLYDLPDFFDINTYLDKSERNIQRVSNKLDDYIKNPNAENIHDIRKAIRRLEATYRSLPSKKVRKKRIIKEYAEYSKRLFSINSQIRDIDIINEKLSGDENFAQQKIIKSIEGSLCKQRQAKLSEAISFALELRKLRVPELSKEMESPNKRSKKRFRKMTSKFATRIEHNLPIVINDSKKITELHELRKDCKKLRYLLELLPENNDKDQGIQKDNYVSQLMEKLENVQDFLGTIHDHDMIVAYLKRHKGKGTRSSVVSSILTRINQQRQSKYEEFVRFVNGDLSGDNNNFFIRTADVLA